MRKVPPDQQHSWQHFFIGLVFVSGCLPFALQAETDWSLCRPQPEFALPDPALLPPSGVLINADSLETEQDQSLLFNGSVTLQSETEYINADGVKVYNEPRRIEAEGNIQIQNDSFIINSDSARFNQEEAFSHFDKARYRYRPKHAYGRASSITTKGKVTTLEHATYSTCNVGDKDWELRAENITLDRDKGIGLATHTSLRFKSVPILYLPFATFPINDQRKSGFLFPSIGRNNETGAEVIIPWYWNLAPNYDLTTTPRIMTRRGVMWNNAFRYLGEDYSGKLDSDYLDKDQVDHEQRFHYNFHHRYQPDDRWRLDLLASRVSDERYFDDFSNSLDLNSTTHLERHADLYYTSRHLNGKLRFQSHQTVDTGIAKNRRPYKRLPQLTLQGQTKAFTDWLHLGFDSDITHFVHDVNVEGNRFDIAPRIGVEYLTPGLFIKPELIWHHTHYRLDEDDNIEETHINRSLPIFNIDSGLFLERYESQNYIQTLEPRFYYLYAPYRDQQDIPVFDTSEPLFSFSSLFRENRFSGIDRIGDANQLTLALTGRQLQKEDGHESLRVSFGQIFHFADRRVTLPNRDRGTSDRSEYATELNFNPNERFSARASLIAESDFATARVGNLQLGYREDNGKLFNIEYRFLEDKADNDNDINQTNLSFAWPVNRQWKLLGRWLYSHEADRDLEYLAAIEYNSCCWGGRITARRNILDDTEEYNDSVYFEIILKGLSSIGEGGDLLEKSITGYIADDE